MEDYKANVNGVSHLVALDEIKSLDLIEQGDGLYHFIENDIGYKVELIRTGSNNDSLLLRINGRPYEVQIETATEALIQKMGFASHRSIGADHVPAPMPGLVLEVLVSAGQEIEKGDPILVLEAMKMENLIKASHSGTVRNVKVEKGHTVEKGQILVEIEAWY